MIVLDSRHFNSHHYFPDYFAEARVCFDMLYNYVEAARPERRVPESQKRSRSFTALDVPAGLCVVLIFALLSGKLIFKIED